MEWVYIFAARAQPALKSSEEQPQRGLKFYPELIAAAAWEAIYEFECQATNIPVYGSQKWFFNFW